MNRLLSLIAIIALGSWVGVEAYVVTARVLAALAPYLEFTLT